MPGINEDKLNKTRLPELREELRGECRGEDCLDADERNYCRRDGSLSIEDSHQQEAQFIMVATKFGRISM